jgi:SGNH hydrolase-like domain, acetyltransferase AlgX
MSMSRRRLLGLAGWITVVTLAFFGGLLYRDYERSQVAQVQAQRAQELVTEAPMAPPPVVDPAKGFPIAGAATPEDPRQPEPRAIEAREARIRGDTAAIEAECRRAAGGDWAKWQWDTAPYRADLKAKVEALKPLPSLGPGYPGLHYQPLEGCNGFPLFQVDPRDHIGYLYEPEKLDAFWEERSVVAASRWLRQKGIDLIFVPVPKMTEVYIDHFLSACPSDGIVAPHVRHTLVDLLKQDVEVVDCLPLFRPLRDTDSEYLYNAADPHWGPRAMRIAAKEIAGRIERYKFGARARYTLPITRTTPETLWLEAAVGGIGSGVWLTLSAEQAARAKQVQTTVLSQVYPRNGEYLPDDPSSPVLLIGNSFVTWFKEQLVKELNLLVSLDQAGGQTTEAFVDFLRDPSILAHTRVIVWLTTEQHMTQFKPMPAPIMQALDTAAPPVAPSPPRP